ncbi:MAG: geranylgeranylglyceryl/heptaprenylglyceryl phosphate synthase [Methanothrix sp.]
MLRKRVEIGPVESELWDAVESHGSAHLTLIDPASQDPERAAQMARSAADAGTTAVMVGGSVGATGSVLDSTVRAIKRSVDLPVILFPSSAAGLCDTADAVFFMSLLNSRSTNYLIENQALGAPIVSRYRLEAIPMGYIVVEPGGTVGWVGDAKLVPRRKPEIAAAYALAGRYLGMRLIYLEAGSGADSPVPANMVSAVRDAIGDAILVVGGGIRDAESASKLVAAGADLIVTGTGVEQSGDVFEFVRSIITAIHV